MRTLLVAITVAAALGCSHPAPPPPAAPAPVQPVAAEPSLPTGKPAGYVEMRPDQVVAFGGGAALVLVDDTTHRGLPIYIGGTEAASIDVRMRRVAPPRPLTHDLLDHVLAKLHATLVKVQVDDIRDETFIGSIFLRANGRVFALDARPSDAIALAIGDHAPIYVSQAVLDEAGVPLDQLQRQLAAGANQSSG